MDMMKNQYQKSSDYKNATITYIPTFEEASYNPQIHPTIKSFEPANILYKSKTLEVLEREFSLKFPGPYQTFVEEQNRRMLDFIETYLENHKEIV
jgi:hypothetical protein